MSVDTIDYARVIVGSTAFTIGGSAVFSSEVSKTSAKPSEQDEQSTEAWSPWGSDNLFPQKAVEDVRKNSVALRALRYRIARHYGHGINTIEWYEDEETGELKKRNKRFPDFVEFTKNNNLPWVMQNVVSDYEWFMNAWVELVLNAKGKIAAVFFQEATDIRYQKKDKAGKIKNVYLSSNWPDPAKGKFKTISMYDPKLKKQPNNFILPICSPSPGNHYYQEAYWNAIRISGWLDIANEVPKWKKAAFKNSTVLKYHVQIPKTYWTERFTNWDSMTNDEKTTAITEKLNEMNDFLTGSDNAMKIFLSHFGVDEQTGKALDGWKIEQLKIDLGDGAYLPDAFAANTEILWGVGINPVLLGMVPGKAMNTGSGSNIQKASEDLESTLFIDRDASLSVLRFIRDFNEWDPNMDFEYAGRNWFQNMSEVTPKDRPLDKTED